MGFDSNPELISKQKVAANLALLQGARGRKERAGGRIQSVVANNIQGREEKSQASEKEGADPAGYGHDNCLVTTFQSASFM